MNKSPEFDMLKEPAEPGRRRGGSNGRHREEREQAGSSFKA
jgi:hypothetical protein